MHLKFGQIKTSGPKVQYFLLPVFPILLRLMLPCAEVTLLGHFHLIGLYISTPLHVFDSSVYLHFRLRSE